jgi:hypothetical protein
MRIILYKWLINLLLFDADCSLQINLQFTHHYSLLDILAYSQLIFQVRSRPGIRHWYLLSSQVCSQVLGRLFSRASNLIVSQLSNLQWIQVFNQLCSPVLNRLHNLRRCLLQSRQLSQLTTQVDDRLLNPLSSHLHIHLVSLHSIRHLIRVFYRPFNQQVDRVSSHLANLLLGQAHNHLNFLLAYLQDFQLHVQVCCQAHSHQFVQLYNRHYFQHLNPACCHRHFLLSTHPSNLVLNLLNILQYVHR